MLPDGTAVRCSFCHRPAVAEGWGWHRLWGVLPLFPPATIIVPSTGQISSPAVPMRRKSPSGQKMIHVSLGDQPGALSQLRAKPAHDRRDIGKLALLEDFDHAGSTAGPAPWPCEHRSDGGILSYRPAFAPGEFAVLPWECSFANWLLDPRPAPHSLAGCVGLVCKRKDSKGKAKRKPHEQDGRDASAAPPGPGPRVRLAALTGFAGINIENEVHRAAGGGFSRSRSNGQPIWLVRQAVERSGVSGPYTVGSALCRSGASP